MADHRIHSTQSGSGPSLLFTHGYGGSAQTWQHQVAAFAPGYCVTTWDLLGHGASAKPTDPTSYSRATALEHLDDLIGQASKPLVLIGHSLGGYLAQCRAINNAEHIKGLVLIASGPGFRSESGRDRWNKSVGKAAIKFDVPNESAGMVEQHDALVMDNLENIQVPVLQIVGCRDKGFLPAVEVLEQRVPDIESMIVPDAGHHVHHSHADTVNPRIAQFLAKLRHV